MRTQPALPRPVVYPMVTSILRFNGQTQQARAQLVPLLREFPQVRFCERTSAEYEVTAADRSTLQALASKPGWSLAGSR
jgi:hypothetical protein